MNGTYDTRNRWADKIAFFSLFIAVLLIARFLIVMRSAILFSEPIELPCAGLSVCVPIGNGWQSESRWEYQQNSFILDSYFNPGRGGAAAAVSCQCLLSAAEVTLNELFGEKASEAARYQMPLNRQAYGVVGRTKIAQTGQIEIGDYSLNWAHIESSPGGSQWSKMPFDIFFGVVQLPNNRRLDIEVYQDTGETELAENVFKSVIERLKFTDNLPLEAGGKIVAEIKNKGLGGFLRSPDGEPNEERFCLIKGTGGLAIGFTMDQTSLLETGLIESGSFFYIRGRLEQAQTAFFQGDSGLNEFKWESRASSPAGRSGAEIVLGKDGIMTIKEFGQQRREKSYQIGPATMPDVVGDIVFSQMLDSDEKEILVDMISADGRIIPALITLRNQSGTDADIEEAAYVFKVELLDGSGFSELAYLDSNGRIMRRLLQQENVYVFERATVEDILREFPEQGRFILQRKDKMLEQSQLQEGSEQ